MSVCFNSAFVDRAITFFQETHPKNIADFANYLQKHSNEAPTVYDQYRFYENCLIKIGNFYSLACFYARSGRIDEAIEAAKKTDNPKHAALFYLKKGDLENAKILEATPSNTCSAEELSGWINYHTLKGTLPEALKSYEHAFPHFNGFISLVKKDYPKACLEFAHCAGHLGIYKAYAQVNIGRYVEAKATLNEWIESRDMLQFPLIEEFELWDALYPLLDFQMKKRMTGTFSLVINHFLALDKNFEDSCLLLIECKVKHKTPAIELFFDLGIKRSNEYLLNLIKRLQNDSPYNQLDFIFIHWCHSLQKFDLIIDYCEMRRSSKSFQFDEEWARAQMTVVATAPAEVLNRMQLTYLESNTTGRTPAIQFQIAYHFLNCGDYRKAEAYLKEYRLFFSGPLKVFLALHNVYMHTVSPEYARTFIINTSTAYKQTEILDLVFKYTHEDPVCELDFANAPYHPKFKEKIENQKILESTAIPQLEGLEFPPKEAVQLLNRFLKRSADAKLVFLRSIYSYLANQKAHSLDDLKHIDFTLLASDLARYFKILNEKHPEFIAFGAKYLPNEGKILAAKYHLKTKEYEKSNALVSEILRQDSTNIEIIKLKIFSLIGMKRYDNARTFINDQMKDNPNNDLSSFLKIIDASSPVIETVKPEPPLEIRKPVQKPAAAAPLSTGFVQEKTRLKETRVGKVAVHAFGGTKARGGVDPIQHSSHFDPRKYKPKEDAEEKRAEGKKEKKDPEKIQPLVEINISNHYRKTLEHARTLLGKAIALKSRHERKEIDDITLRNNLFYTFLRVFEIISFRTLDSDLLAVLQSRRGDARRNFNLITLNNANSCLQYLINIKLNEQIYDWINGLGIINRLALSPYPLVDKDLLAKWESLSQKEKDDDRIAFMKAELKNLVRFMNAVKTEGVFAGDGPDENGAKMSIMMIGKSWSMLRQTEKEKLARFFRPFNIEGNKAAHQFKADSEQDHIKFMLSFEDILLEDMWKFAENAPKLIEFLEQYGTK